LRWEDPIPDEVEAGTRVALRIRVSCPSGCDMRGARIEVSGVGEETASATVGVDAALSESTAGGSDQSTPGLAVVPVITPCRINECVWTVTAPEQEIGGRVHEECSISYPVRVVSHGTSLAVWDVPSPVPVDSTFTVKAGVLCSVSCNLGGEKVEIHDEAGIKLGEAILGLSPWAGTRALYWTELALRAPATEGVTIRSLRLTLAGAEASHEPAHIALSFRTDRPPEHRVTMRVIDQGRGAPVQDVEVRLGSYMTSTDHNGLAELMVPPTYALDIRKDGFTAAPIRLDVMDSLTIDLPLASAPTRAELDERIFDEYPWG
jgi:hypothetical protein